MDEKKTKTLKIVNIITNVLLYTFFGISMILLIFSIASKKDSDGAVDVLGYQIRVVISESMEKHEDTYKEIKKYRIKSLPIRTMVLVKMVPNNDEKAEKWYEDIKIGDVLTFRYVVSTKQETITHRVIDINPNKNGEGYTIELRGDNKGTKTQAGVQTIDTSLEETPNYVIGKVIFKSYIIGLLITALKSRIGIIFMVIIPSLIIMIFEVVRIVNYFNGERKKKELEKEHKQKDEIEELKRKIAELSGNSKADESKDDSVENKMT